MAEGFTAEARHSGERSFVAFAGSTGFVSAMLRDGGSIDVYGLDLDRWGEESDVFQAVLSGAERLQIARLTRRRQRSRLIIARGVLRMILGAYTGMAPADVTLWRDARGKPHVGWDGHCDHHRLHVSCSRSGSRAIVAVAKGQPIGADIEIATDERFPDALAEFILSASERSCYAALHQRDRVRWLARVWVRKEAIVKAMGCGLEIDPRSFSAAISSYDEAAADAEASIARQAGVSAPWCVWESAWGSSVIAVASRTGASSMRFFELSRSSCAPSQEGIAGAELSVIHNS